MPTHLAIRNMVCNRCIRVVSDELHRLGFQPTDVRLGEVQLPEDLSPTQRESIRSMLSDNGFELLDDKRQKLIEQAKLAIIDLIQHGDERTLSTVVISQYLATKLQSEYTHISTLFSQIEGLTLEKYVILQKTERVKELMMYDEQSISEIAFRLGYSSVHHLSNQFKKVTGMTPTQFRKLQQKPRVALDQVREGA